jgi:hypothetical protein
MKNSSEWNVFVEFLFIRSIGHLKISLIGHDPLPPRRSYKVTSKRLIVWVIAFVNKLVIEVDPGIRARS